MSSAKYDLSETTAVFFSESREMLEEMESCLLDLDKGVKDSETMNALFRSVHTIKGSSGMFGYETIEKFTHTVENLLDLLRNDKIPITEDLSQILFESHDMMSLLLSVHEEPGAEVNEELSLKKSELTQRLEAFIEERPEPASETEETEQHEEQEEIEASEESDSDLFYEEDEHVSNECWHISLRCSGDVFKNGLDPMPLISYLKEFGKIEKLITVSDDLPEPQEFNPEICYLGFEIAYYSDADRKTIETVFDFIREDSELRIIPPKSRMGEYLELIENLPESPMQIGEMLVNIGSLTPKELDKILEIQDEVDTADQLPEQKKKLGEIIVENKFVQKPVVDAALEKQSEVRTNEETRRKSIRIDPDKLDSLINLVGELVINGSNVQQRSETIGDSDLAESVSTMSRLIEDIRDSTMNIRMVQIGETFKRFERIIRDLSRERGKDIKLRISGGDTELDKILTEKLSDPLMHLVRNAADHGLGTPEERKAAGKPPTGTIYLNSYHETGSIVIEVSDDGWGLNREKIYDKAVSLGFIQPGQQIQDQELYHLIFEPGFSTADKITNISGRGVGMDVVKQNIESMRGQVHIESNPNEGTKFRIHLPLTLAIIDGFMFQVGKSNFVVPLDMVTECIEVSAENIKTSESGRFINLRGDVLPFMKLREFFQYNENSEGRENVIVMNYARKKAGLIVDRLVGEFQTVIKPLGKVFHNLKWISGSTILGSGEVALILDVPHLINYISKKEGAVKD